MLGCHDGIPVLDLKGLLPDEHIDSMIKTIVNRGGHVKDLHGKKDMYYQVNSTYYSALGENDKKFILARAIQMFMPGKPQIWYLDLFAGKNDYDAIHKGSSAQHKEINRTNLTLEHVRNALPKEVVKQQLSLIQFRNTFPAFGFDAKATIIKSPDSFLKVKWENNGYCAFLEADLVNYDFKIKAVDSDGVVCFTQSSIGGK
jgi:sucrose phosphorylase